MCAMLSTATLLSGMLLLLGRKSGFLIYFSLLICLGIRLHCVQLGPFRLLNILGLLLFVKLDNK